jgi:hypothetical protein
LPPQPPSILGEMRKKKRENERKRKKKREEPLLRASFAT